MNRKSEKQNCIFIGTDLDFFDESEDFKFDKPKGEIWLAYIGTLGSSYEIEMVIDALEILKHKGIRNLKFIIMGPTSLLLLVRASIAEAAARHGGRRDDDASQSRGHAAAGTEPLLHR